MMPGVNEITEFWIRLTQGRNVSLLLATAAVALTATVDLLQRLGRARTARRLRVAAAAYAEREIAKASQKLRKPTQRLRVSGASA
ncbi:MAG TPA: hypothetical protein VGH74_21685 [Planctomycetaceae bacterium]|jgi:hypothetical protein